MISINFVGDVAIFKEYEKRQHDPFANVILPESSLNVANFEFPIPDDKTAKGFYDVDDNYRISERFSRQLKMGKFNLYSLANNHIQDYGAEGIKQTIEKISSAGSAFFGVGTQKINTASYTIKEVTFLFIAFVKKGRWDRQVGALGPDSYDMDEIIAFISSNKAKHDHIIIFPHWGTELVDVPDPHDVNSARRMIDAGARCVIGHHPHIPQGSEHYKSGLIAYSLGSFIYLPDFEKGNADRAPERDISICLNVQFSKKSIISCTPYKYILNKNTLTPICHGDYRSEKKYQELCRLIGDRKHYSKRVRSVLLRREFFSFLSRFRDSPINATIHYLKYIKPKHFKKIVGLH